MLVWLVWLIWGREDTYGMTSRCVVTLDNTTTTTATVVASLATVTAAFGPPLAQGGVRGVLYQLTPADGCSPVAHADKDGDAWIALVEKGNCGFHDKVFNAQLAGAAAAVVYDNEDAESLVLMTAKDASDIHMSSVFTSKQDGQLLHFITASQQQGERVMAVLEPDIDYVVPDRILTWILTPIFVFGFIFFTAMGAVGIREDRLRRIPVNTPADEKDVEDVVVVNCEAAAPPLASAVTSDGHSKLEQGQRAMKLDTAPLLQDCECQQKGDTPPLYRP
eukprot:jgi/Chlat1/19/ChrspC228293S00903